MMRAKSACLRAVEYVSVSVGFGNAQHLQELRTIMYTGVAFTLEMMYLIPHKITTLSKVFFLDLFASCAKHGQCTWLHKSGTKTYQKGSVHLNRKHSVAAQCFSTVIFLVIPCLAEHVVTWTENRKQFTGERRFLHASCPVISIQKVSGENLLHNCVLQPSFS